MVVVVGWQVELGQDVPDVLADRWRSRIAAVAASAAISGLVLGGLRVAFAQAAGFTPIVLPWPAIGMIAGGGALIGVVASTLPVITSPVFRARR